MRIRILSDLHREFGFSDIPKLNSELIILAGDIDTKLNGLKWISEFSENTPTVYVCGNHEFYGAKFPRVIEKLQAETQGSNVHVLENQTMVFNGWNIFGCTLWTDLSLINDWKEGSVVVGEAMNDYKRVRNSDRGYKRLSPLDTRLRHLESLTKMEEFLEENDQERSIIVTHHAPSILSLPECRRETPLSCAYASRLDDLILKYQPHLWIHGHIHHSSDYRIGKTRILANPQGYPDEPNINFNSDLVVDL